jgi:large subunit ribosomal protein L25
MNVVEVVAHKRDNFKKNFLKKLRKESKVPGIIYGGNSQNTITFYTYMYFLEKLVRGVEVNFIDLNIEGEIVRCIIKEVHFHPVSDIILHIDFLRVFEDKELRMNIPIKIGGNCQAITMGGILSLKERILPVVSLPQNMPSIIYVDITNIQLKQVLRISDLKLDNFKILKDKFSPVLSIELSRALKSAEVVKEKSNK